nr:MAG TPA: hypothetical protein [Caudoviricetes sp.]
MYKKSTIYHYNFMCIMCIFLLTFMCTMCII